MVVDYPEAGLKPKMVFDCPHLDTFPTTAISLFLYFFYPYKGNRKYIFSVNNVKGDLLSHKILHDT